MKKILSLILAALIVCPALASAGSMEAVFYRARTSTGVLMTDLAIANAATVYTEAIPVDDNAGFSSILVIEDKSGGAGSVTITAEYSLDGTNFYTVYTTSGGSLTAESAIVTTLANQTRWIQHTARLARYVRYKIVAGADSEVTFDTVWQRTR